MNQRKLLKVYSVKVKEMDKAELDTLVDDFLSKGGEIEVLPSYKVEAVRTTNPYNHMQDPLM